MKLLDAYRLVEQDMPDLEENTIELPISHFVISVFSDEKALLFSPIEHKSITHAVKELVQDLKNNFRIDTIEDKGGNVFKVQIDPAEDFDGVINYIKKELETNEGL